MSDDPVLLSRSTSEESSGWSAGSSGATLGMPEECSAGAGPDDADNSGNRQEDWQEKKVPPLPMKSPPEGRMKLSGAQASTGRLPVPSGISPRASPRKLKQIGGRPLDGSQTERSTGQRQRVRIGRDGLPLKPTPPNYPRPNGGSFTARGQFTRKPASSMIPIRGSGRNPNSGSAPLKRQHTASAGLSLPVDTKPTVLTLQHFSPNDSSKVMNVLVLSNMKGIATSLMSACGSDPCIRCIVPDLEAKDFDQPGSGSVKAMRDARIAIVDPDLFSPLLRHARHLEWLQTTARDSQTIADQLARVRTEAVRRKMQSQNLIRRLEEHRQRMAEESEHVKSEMAKVQPGLEAARQAILSLNKRSIGELRSFTNPPDMVKSCLGAVFRMLASAQASEPIHGRLGWSEILKITHKQGFIASVVAFDPSNFTKALRRKVKQEYFSLGSPDQLKIATYHASTVAGHLHVWLCAQMKYAEALEVIIPMRLRIKKLEDECSDMAEELERVEELTSGTGPNYVMTRISGGYGGMVAEYVLGNIISLERNFLGLMAQQAMKTSDTPMASLPVSMAAMTGSISKSGSATQRANEKKGKEKEESSSGVGVGAPSVPYTYRAMCDLTIGIIGLGESGINISRVAKAMGMNVLSIARRQRPLKTHKSKNSVTVTGVNTSEPKMTHSRSNYSYNSTSNSNSSMNGNGSGDGNRRSSNLNSIVGSGSSFGSQPQTQYQSQGQGLNDTYAHAHAYAYPDANSRGTSGVNDDYSMKIRMQRALRREMGLGAHGQGSSGGYLGALERKQKMKEYVRSKSGMLEEEEEEIESGREKEKERRTKSKKSSLTMSMADQAGGRVSGSYDCDPAYTPLYPNSTTGEWADECYVAADLEHVLSESDYVVIALPQTEDTMKLLNEESIRFCKPSAVLINVGAAACLPADLIEKALDNGWVSGVITDSLELEADSPLWTKKGLTITPHVAARPTNALPEVVSVFKSNVLRKMNEKRMLYKVDFFDWDYLEQGQSRWKLVSGLGGM